jgi:hypothetical protein
LLLHIPLLSSSAPDAVTYACLPCVLFRKGSLTMVPTVDPCKFTGVSEEPTPSVFIAGDHASQAVRADKCSDVSEKY